jgi:hypothetical protein
MGELARFTFAHLALCVAAMRFLPAAEIVLFGISFCSAHHALCAGRLPKLCAPFIMTPEKTKPSRMGEHAACDRIAAIAASTRCCVRPLT